jgi:hypothetical protein
MLWLAAHPPIKNPHCLQSSSQPPPAPILADDSSLQPAYLKPDKLLYITPFGSSVNQQIAIIQQIKIEPHAIMSALRLDDSVPASFCRPHRQCYCKGNTSVIGSVIQLNPHNLVCLAVLAHWFHQHLSKHSTLIYVWSMDDVCRWTSNCSMLAQLNQVSAKTQPPTARKINGEQLHRAMVFGAPTCSNM